MSHSCRFWRSAARPLSGRLNSKKALIGLHSRRLHRLEIEIMKSWTLITVAFLSFMIPSTLPARTEAEELRVLSTHAFLEVLTALTPAFENESGCKVTFGFDPSNVIKRQIEAGAPFDVA